MFWIFQHASCHLTCEALEQVIFAAIVLLAASAAAQPFQPGTGFAPAGMLVSYSPLCLSCLFLVVSCHTTNEWGPAVVLASLFECFLTATCLADEISLLQAT